MLFLWVFSNEELQEVIRTKRVYICIIGPGMPPISPAVRLPE